MDAQNELDFLAALEAFRRARDSGDAEAREKAEKALQDHVRAELTGEGTNASEGA